MTALTIKLLALLATVQAPERVELDLLPSGAVVLIETDDSLHIVGESVVDTVRPCEPAFAVTY